MVRSHKTKERNTRLELAEKARQVIEEIDDEAQVRMEEGRLSEEAYQDWNDHFQKRIDSGNFGEFLFNLEIKMMR